MGIRAERREEKEVEGSLIQRPEGGRDPEHAKLCTVREGGEQRRPG